MNKLKKYKCMKKKEKIIMGYKLLQDLPDLKKGVIFKLLKREPARILGVHLFNCQEYTYNYKEKGINAFYNPKNVENNPKWFKPIYEKIK
jgi:hypothetical protein